MYLYLQVFDSIFFFSNWTGIVKETYCHSALGYNAKRPLR